LQVFKEPLECPILRGGPIVSTEDVKGIFGNIVDILEVHGKIKVMPRVVLSGTNNLKSVRFFKIVLRYDYS